MRIGWDVHYYFCAWLADQCTVTCENITRPNYWHAFTLPATTQSLHRDGPEWERPICRPDQPPWQKLINIISYSLLSPVNAHLLVSEPKTLSVQHPKSKYPGSQWSISFEIPLAQTPAVRWLAMISYQRERHISTLVNIHSLWFNISRACAPPRRYLDSLLSCACTFVSGNC